MLKGRRIVVGVTGGIAAYKTCELVRLCVKTGADVQIAMTPSATEFVTPLTFDTLSGHPAVVSLWEHAGPAATEHIELARWGEIICVAPATANTLAKVAHGIADNFLTTLILSTRTPVVFAPAMNTAMWEAPATTRNVTSLRDMGYTVTATGAGSLACGEEGDGRMLEASEIFDALVRALPKKGPLAGKRIVVTAGPTPEPIDPVRMITNRSSGKMGVALAEAAVGLGAEVTFIHGPLQVPLPAAVDAVRVETAAQMLDATREAFAGADALVMAAAVADFRPERVSEQKIKKDSAKGGRLTLELTRTADILAEVGRDRTDQIMVGFAMESDPDGAEERARKRLEVKKLDLVALNMLGEPGSGFSTDTNRITLVAKDGSTRKLDLMSKADAAAEILQEVASLLQEAGRKG